MCFICSVTCAWKEPVPGWINSKNGPSGFFMGAAKGVVRRLPVGKNLVYDYIPVDIVINEMLVAAWHAATKKYEFASLIIFFKYLTFISIIIIE